MDAAQQARNKEMIEEKRRREPSDSLEVSPIK
jgi:hypothetical protein